MYSIFIQIIMRSYQRNGEEAGILSVCLCPSSEVRMPSLSAILVTLDKTAAITQKQNMHIKYWKIDVITVNIIITLITKILFTFVVKLVANVTSCSFFKCIMTCRNSVGQWKVGLVYADGDMIEAVWALIYRWKKKFYVYILKFTLFCCSNKVNIVMP